MIQLKSTNLSTTRRSALATIASAVCLPSQALAQGAFPDRPVKLVVPLPPGGAVDRMARLIAEKLSAHWGQPVLVENRAGGGIVVGTLAVARSQPDGYTLGLLGTGISINASQPSDQPFELKELRPISRIGFSTEALLAVQNFPANDVKGLVAHAKAHPLAYGSNGIGSTAELAGEMLNQMAGLQLQHIPYNGAARMYTEMLGGQIPLGIGVLGSAQAHIKSGKLKVIGVTSARRSKLFPEYPSIGETLPGFQSENWVGVLVPAAVPAAVVQKIARDIATVTQDRQLQIALADMGVDVAPQGPEEFSAFINEEVARFSKLQAKMPKKARTQ